MSKKRYKAQPADFHTKHPAGIQAHINRTVSWKSSYNKLNQMAVKEFHCLVLWSSLQILWTESKYKKASAEPKVMK